LCWSPHRCQHREHWDRCGFVTGEKIANLAQLLPLVANVSLQTKTNQETRNPQSTNAQDQKASAKDEMANANAIAKGRLSANLCCGGHRACACAGSVWEPAGVNRRTNRPATSNQQTQRTKWQNANAVAKGRFSARTCAGVVIALARAPRSWLISSLPKRRGISLAERRKAK
jgi:hypothetical protein